VYAESKLAKACFYRRASGGGAAWVTDVGCVAETTSDEYHLEQDNSVHILRKEKTWPQTCCS
jgi:hypothetical protein